ncbi:MAG: hypothetical protein J1E40_01535 [Oscillospiraceae bacterium]|nr:hypothetical protein [Oscillospiraceae bacterium]
MSYISPVGTGVSGSMTGFGGASYGMGVYRKNNTDPTNSAEQLERGTFQPVKNGENNYRNGKPVKDENDYKRRFDSFECQTCKNRRYQDGSDDPGVSFQTPTKVNPNAAGAAVRSHEQEHVSRNQAKARQEGKEIVSQSVTIHTAICPECGRVYISGGTTRTTIRSSSDSLADQYAVGLSDPSRDSGRGLNTAA